MTQAVARGSSNSKGTSAPLQPKRAMPAGSPKADVKECAKNGNIALNTFTLRVPRLWVGRISGSRMRMWISEFRSALGQLLPVSSELDARISLRLPTGQVRELVDATGLDQSEALRRVIALGLKRILADQQARRTPPPELTPNDFRIVSEEVIGEDVGGVVILQRDARGLGYTRTLPFSREVYMTLRRR